MRSNYKKLGSYIREVDIRNKEAKEENLLGVSTQKVFIESIANTVGTDFTKYKTVKRNQFTYVPDTSRRGDKIGLAMLEHLDEGIVSQAYTVFEIIDHEALDPEYLMMWFRRPEFDRYARYKSHGSVREIFGWDEMCDVELPIPAIEKQREIVREYNTIVNRIQLNEQLNQKLEETAQAIYKHWFVDFEFPISAEFAASIGKSELEGKPYKSSGGEMVFCEKSEREIPKGWSTEKLDKLYKFQYGKGNANPDNGGKYPVYGSNGIIGGFDRYNNENSPVIGHIGSCGSLVFVCGKHYVTYNGIMCNIKPPYKVFFGYCTLLSCNLVEQVRGSTQPFVSYDMLYDIDFMAPSDDISDHFSAFADQLFKKQITSKKMIERLNDLKQILFSKMAAQQNDGEVIAA